MNAFNPERALTSMAQDLTEIVRLYGELNDEAESRASHKGIPGGDALVYLGPVSLTADWQARFDAAEESGDDTMYANDQVAERHLLIVLGDWSENVRTERGERTALRITVERAADYLRKVLPWIVEEYDAAPMMASELRGCRSALENLLHDGVRHDRAEVECLQPVGEPDDDGTVESCGGRLELRYRTRRDCKHVRMAEKSAKGLLDPAVVLRRLLREFPDVAAEHANCDQGGREDLYRCERCLTTYNEAQYWTAVRAAAEAWQAIGERRLA